MITIVPINQSYSNYAAQIREMLNNFVVEINSNFTQDLQSRCGDSNIQIVVGERDVRNRTVCLRNHNLVINSRVQIQNLPNYVQNLDI